MVRMNKRLHRKIQTFCIVEDITQREFIETAAELFLRNLEMHNRLRHMRRKAHQKGNG